ncbi:MAG: hypothetical protein ACR2GC_00410 [Methyloceanibacter sp.]|uniref:hypothetical protein n=1 Tax=Methyloceanibacter sp. TaxID=1965321 RepID=UPI003D9B382D
MLRHTRRRALALLLAAAAASFVPAHPIFAQDDDAGEEEGPPECYETQKFGTWLGRASDRQAGAGFNDVPFKNSKTSPLRADMQVSVNYDARLVLYGDFDKVQFSKDFLIDPANRLIMRDENGKEAVNEALCGNCNAIEEDKFSVVLPLSTAPLLRESPAIEIAFKLVGLEESGFRLTLGNMRKALIWANKRKTALAEQIAEGKCVSPGIEE